MARPEGVEPPTAWFVVFRLKYYISLYYIAFIRLRLSNKISLFGLICLYSGLFGAIYWTTETVDSLGHESDNYMIIARPFCVTQQNGL